MIPYQARDERALLEALSLAVLLKPAKLMLWHQHRDLIRPRLHRSVMMPQKYALINRRPHHRRQTVGTGTLALASRSTFPELPGNRGICLGLNRWPDWVERQRAMITADHSATCALFSAHGPITGHRSKRRVLIRPHRRHRQRLRSRSRKPDLEPDYGMGASRISRQSTPRHGSP